MVSDPGDRAGPTGISEISSQPTPANRDFKGPVSGFSRPNSRSRHGQVVAQVSAVAVYAGRFTMGITNHARAIDRPPSLLN